jgi:hypothetical protein
MQLISLFITTAFIITPALSQFKRVSGNLLRQTSGKSTDGVTLLMSQKVELPYGKRFLLSISSKDARINIRVIKGGGNGEKVLTWETSGDWVTTERLFFAFDAESPFQINVYPRGISEVGAEYRDAGLWEIGE